ncbi:urea transporter [Sphingomonas sp. 3-13AW]|uniref:urea transporter n=1 Tax=Sphingomonas sp. 3-13AW TaxID=3050450 RepID=UPI003BB6B99B
MRGKNGNFLTTCLKGTSQVFFMENAITGALFFLAIFYASFVSGVWATSLGAILGVVVATAVANILAFDESSRLQGLFGFNGILIGIALPTFVATSPQLWLYIIVGAALTTVVTAAFAATLTKSWGVPGSTGPFVLTGWLLMAGSYSFGSLRVLSETQKLASDYLMGAAALPRPIELVEIFFRNIGQVYLLDSWISGAIILLGIFVASRPAGIAAVGGSLLALVTAFVMRADPSLVSQGLYGFSPVLTAMALSVVFVQPSALVVGYAALGVIVTVFLQGAFDLILAPIGLPAFTSAYVLTMYLFIAPRKFAPPHPHTPLADHALGRAGHAPAAGDPGSSDSLPPMTKAPA